MCESGDLPRNVITYLPLQELPFFCHFRCWWNNATKTDTRIQQQKDKGTQLNGIHRITMLVLAYDSFDSPLGICESNHAFGTAFIAQQPSLNESEALGLE